MPNSRCGLRLLRAESMYGLGGTCPTPGVAEASSELKTGLASTGIANRGRSLAPVPAKLYVGHFGITLALVYLTRAMALMAEGRRC